MLLHRIKNPHPYNKRQEVCTIACLDCGFIEAPRGFSHKKRFLDQYELLYVTKGSVSLKLNGTPVRLDKHMVIVLPPYKTLEGQAPCAQPTGFYYVNFTTDHPQNFCIFTDKPLTCHSTRALEILDQMNKQKSSAWVPDYVMDSGLLLLLHEISGGWGGSTGSEEIASRIQRYVESHISQPLTADVLSKELTYNKDYLCKIVKKHFGVSLKDYIVRQKLDLAKKLLTTSNYSVGEIAGMTGFSEPNLFTKFFKYHTHQSPGDYRFTHGS